MLHYITVATHSERYLPVLEKQLEDKGKKLNKLGFGKKYSGHFMKDLETIEFLKDKNPDDLVIFLDGFDSLSLSSEEEIIEKFKSFNKKLVISVENIRNAYLTHSYVFQKVLGKYINTGLFMGEVRFVRDFLERMYSKEYDKKSNQKTWCKFLNSEYNEYIGLDRDSLLFLNHSFTCNNSFKLKNKRIELDNNNKPCFIQGNGCYNMDYIIKELGYSKNNIHKNSFLKDTWKYNFKTIFKTYPIIRYLIFSIICGLLFVLFIFYFGKKSLKYKDLNITIN